MDNKNIDKKIDETLQQCFDAQKHTAPPNLWDDIAMALDGEELLDTKLKETQEEIVQTAPVGLWAAISNDLDTTEQLDNTIDEKVKEGIAQQPLQTAPLSAWEAIDRQLNLNQTWENIAAVLPKEGTTLAPAPTTWRTYATRIGAAAMLLLLLKTCVGGDNWTADTPLATNQSIQNKIEQPSTTSTLGNSKTTIGNTVEKVTTAMTTPKTRHQSTEESIASNTVNNTSENNLKAIASDYILEKTAVGKSNFKKNKEKKATLTTSMEEQASLGKEKVITQGNTSANTIVSKGELNTNKQINTINRQLLPWSVVFPSEEFDVLDNELETAPSPLAGKLSAGVFTVFNNTTLLNEETKEGIRGSDRIQNTPRFAANYGIWVGYQFLPKSSLVVEFSINADNRQAYRIVEDRVTYIKEWVMKYNRISLAYQHDLMQTAGKKVQSRITAQGGVYLGMLRQAKLFYDGELFFDAIADHHQFDFGFKLAVGQELVFGKFALGYGIRSDIGAINIFRGNTIFSAQENKTNLIQLGGYVTLGYRF